MKPIKTLVLTADDARARLFENAGPGRGLTELEDMDVHTVPGAGVKYADRPGRMNAAPGMAQHALTEPQEILEDQAREGFARAIAEELETRFDAGHFDRLVLVAAPDMLGALRDALSDKLTAAVVAERDRDYVKLDPAEVAERLGDQIVL